MTEPITIYYCFLVNEMRLNFFREENLINGMAELTMKTIPWFSFPEKISFCGPLTIVFFSIFEKLGAPCAGF